MKASHAASITNIFPLSWPSPVRDVIAASQYESPSPLATIQTVHSDPSTIDTSFPGGQKRNLSSSLIDSDLYTPSRRVCLMTSATASTSSGSYLIDKNRISNDHIIHSRILRVPPSLPAVNWSLIHHPIRSRSHSHQQFTCTELATENAILGQ